MCFFVGALKLAYRGVVDDVIPASKEEVDCLGIRDALSSERVRVHFRQKYLRTAHKHAHLEAELSEDRLTNSLLHSARAALRTLEHDVPALEQGLHLAQPSPFKGLAELLHRHALVAANVDTAQKRDVGSHLRGLAEDRWADVRDVAAGDAWGDDFPCAHALSGEDDLQHQERLGLNARVHERCRDVEGGSLRRR